MKPPKKATSLVLPLGRRWSAPKRASDMTRGWRVMR
jgi:hypothetical protein